MARRTILASFAVTAAAFAPGISVSSLRASHVTRSRVPALQMSSTMERPPALFPTVGGDAISGGVPLRKEDEWISKMDLVGFGKEIDDLGKRLKAGQNEDDVKHIKKICLWSNSLFAFGLATMWLPPNPLTVMALSLATFSRWTTIAHHTCHGGYNNCDEQRFFNSKGFAIGSITKRLQQWFDWMLPEAWNVEHNNLHHYRLGEVSDPDLLERNMESVRNRPEWPKLKKYSFVTALIFTWKWFYYAPNTYKELKIANMRKQGIEITEEMNPTDSFTLKAFFEKEKTQWYSGRELMTNVLGPYLALHFFVLPAPLLFLGKTYFFNAVKTLFAAELLTNAHAFLAIATNHCGDDLYRFEGGCKPKSATFYLRQVVSSANYPTGANRFFSADVNDFLHGWLNYQVEHHMWPELSALSYQKAQPEVKAICEKYGVPYTQQNVFRRLKKTVDIMVGDTSMREYPPAYEHQPDAMVWRT